MMRSSNRENVSHILSRCFNTFQVDIQRKLCTLIVLSGRRRCVRLRCLSVSRIDAGGLEVRTRMCVAACFAAGTFFVSSMAMAQTAEPVPAQAEPTPAPPAASTPLPPVTVETTAQPKKAAAKKKAKAKQQAPVAAGPTPPQVQPQTAPTVARGAPGSGTGPLDGYVATNTTTGTKTDTPLREVPQSVWVVGKEQMRDQGVQNLQEAFRYVPGRGRRSLWLRQPRRRGDRARHHCTLFRRRPTDDLRLQLDDNDDRAVRAGARRGAARAGLDALRAVVGRRPYQRGLQAAERDSLSRRSGSSTAPSISSR